MKLQIHTSAPLSVWLGISDMQQSCKPLQALESNLLNERAFVWLANLTKLSFDNDCPIPSSKAIWMARCKCSGQELKAQPKGPAVIDVQELGTVVNTYLNRHHPGRFFHLNQKGNKWVFPNTGEVLRWTWSSQGWKNLFGSLQITYPKVIETHRQNQDVKGRALGSLLLTSMGCVCSAKELSTAAVLRRRAAANSARKSSSGSLKSCLLISLSLDIYWLGWGACNHLP